MKDQELKRQNYALILFVQDYILQNQVRRYKMIVMIQIYQLCQNYQIIHILFHLFKNLKNNYKLNQINRDIKLKEIENENQKLIKDNKNLKRLLQKFNLTENIDTKQQQDQILQLQEQINDQQLLISDYYYKLKQYKDQNQCKKLNDFILKKRKKFDQPVFNLELVKRKLTLDVNRSRDESKQTSLEPRIHSKTIYYKY